MNLLDLIRNGGLYESQAEDKRIFFRECYEKLYPLHYVTKDFLKAIEEREREYPTGIQGEICNVALPHVEAKYVKKNALFIFRLKHALPFVRMDKHEETIHVNYIFLLLISNLQFHVKAISELTHIWTDDDIMKGLSVVQNGEELLLLLERKWKNTCERRKG